MTFSRLKTKHKIWVAYAIDLTFVPQRNPRYRVGGAMVPGQDEFLPAEELHIWTGTIDNPNLKLEDGSVTTSTYDSMPNIFSVSPVGEESNLKSRGIKIEFSLKNRTAVSELINKNHRNSRIVFHILTRTDDEPIHQYNRFTTFRGKHSKTSFIPGLTTLEYERPIFFMRSDSRRWTTASQRALYPDSPGGFEYVDDMAIKPITFE